MLSDSFLDAVDAILLERNQSRIEYIIEENEKENIFSQDFYRQRTYDQLSIPKLRLVDLVGKIKVDGTEPSFEETVSNKEASIMEHFEQRIFKKLIFPVSWEKDGISKPNLEAKKNAFNICRKLFESYGLLPDKILASKEEGIFISYDFIDDNCNRSLIIETYNDCETAAIVCNNSRKEIVLSEDICDLSFNNVIRLFKEANC